MYSKVNTAIIDGIEAKVVSVEVDISTGMPIFDMVGRLAMEVKEAKERVKTALHNCGIILPPKRITMNIYPADITKSGTGFDLPIAIALMEAMGALKAGIGKEYIIVGELGLDGSILPASGILPIVYDCFENGYKKYILPRDNHNEASLIKNAEIYSFSNLMDVIDFLRHDKYEKPYIIEEAQTNECEKDFLDVNGQTLGRRVCEIAASGMHNLLFVGSPGAGKTMLAERIPGILPPLTEQEKIEVSKIYSICGMLNNKNALMYQRPFQNPHHTITKIALAGGGRMPTPGVISLAHNGILFLDELTEFSKETLEILRQPLEEGVIRIHRANNATCFPANILLVGAMNPCNCGYYPNMNRCHCTYASLKRHLDKLSQPLIDRIDICVQTQPLEFQELSEENFRESSLNIRKRVASCHEIQSKRYANELFLYNSQIPASKIEEYCILSEEAKKYARIMYEKYQLSVRGYHKILKVARTIADMDTSESLELKHLQEAFMYRCLDESYFGGVK